MRILLIILIFLISNSIHSANKFYSSTFDDSIWDENFSKMSCEMSHDISKYGTINFVKQAGNKVKAKLTIDHDRMQDLSFGKVFFKKPYWHRKDVKIKGWTFKFGTNTKSINFSSKHTRRLLDALNEGYEVSIMHKDNNDKKNIIEATIIPIGFNKAFDNFLKCEKKLIPYSFKQVNKSAVYFDTASFRLNDHAIQLLDSVALYAKDDSVQKIILSGYTDNIGNFRANHKLASIRAQKVKDYLLKVGVKENIINIKVYGELNSNNNTEASRKKNRKVNIRIIR